MAAEAALRQRRSHASPARLKPLLRMWSRRFSRYYCPQMSRIGIEKLRRATAAGCVWGCVSGVTLGLLAVGSLPARAADHIRVATLKTGTVAWELEVVRS